MKCPNGGTGRDHNHQMRALDATFHWCAFCGTVVTDRGTLIPLKGNITMTPDTAETIRLIQAEIDNLPEGDKAVASFIAQMFRFYIQTGGASGVLALALVGAEVQGQNE